VLVAGCGSRPNDPKVPKVTSARAPGLAGAETPAIVARPVDERPSPVTVKGGVFPAATFYDSVRQTWVHIPDLQAREVYAYRDGGAIYFILRPPPESLQGSLLKYRLGRMASSWARVEANATTDACSVTLVFRDAGSAVHLDCVDRPGREVGDPPWPLW
jgi:hypothetical protein